MDYARWILMAQVQESKYAWVGRLCVLFSSFLTAGNLQNIPADMWLPPLSPTPKAFLKEHREFRILFGLLNGHPNLSRLRQSYSNLSV